MIDTTQLANAFGLNVRIVRMQTEGLSHADSLLQPPFRGNCLNWVLGHLAVSRDRVLGLLGEHPLLDDARRVVYETESQPITGAIEGLLTLEQLLDVLGRGQERIATGLERLTPEALAREIQVGPRTMTVGQRLFGLYFHDTYHTGQTELLRQLAGANDKVI